MVKDEKIKVLQVNKLYHPCTGGIECVVQQIAEGLSDRTSMEVLVCNQGIHTCVTKINDVNVTRAGSLFMLGNLPISLKLISQLKHKSNEADILIFHMPFPMGDLAYLLANIKQKRYIVWWHSDIVRQKRMLKVYKPLMKWFLKNAERIIVATEGHITGSDYLQEFKEKCVVIPFGLRNDIERDSEQYIRNNNMDIIDKKITKFLFVGRLVYYKGCHILLQAFKNLENAELVIAGSGPLECELKKYVEDYNMQDRVVFKHDMTDRQIMDEYRNCDVFVLPSTAKSEAFGLVQIEAMSYGKPVINTYLDSGVPYVSVNKISGLTVKPGDVDALHYAMQWLMTHPRERSQYGKNARMRVQTEYTSQVMLNKLFVLLQETLEI